MEKKEEIFQHIHSDTIKKISEENYDNLGLDALEISLSLKMDRSNTSRILNALFNEGRLIKTATRPVVFIDRSAISSSFQNINVPSVITKDKSIKDYLNTSKQTVPTNNINTFSRYITNPRQSKMAEPIAKAKAAILYPDSLNILIIGERGSGRLQFAKAIVDFAQSKKIVDKNIPSTIIDCLNYNSSEDDTFLKMLFGEYISATGSYKKGLLQTSQKNIIVFNNIDELPIHVSDALMSAILDNVFSPINSRKQITLNSIIIATFKNDSKIKNPDMRRSFPMIINMPSLNERTITEKIVLTLQYFQDEAERINKTIRVSKDVLSCFVMSEYNGNLSHLRAEIRQSCALGYTCFIQSNQSFIDIGFDEISTSVLNNIINVNDHLTDLYDTLNLFNKDYLFFSAIQQNPELDMLYNLDKPTISDDILPIKKTMDDLFNQCISDIDAANSIQLNTIRSVLLQEIYDIIYPLLKSHPINKNENLIYGLLTHISTQIKHISSDDYSPSFSKLSSKIAKKVDYELANNIKKEVELHYNVQLNEAEIDYIATYLYLSSQWIEKKYIQILLVSYDKNIVKNYAEYINSQNFKTYVSHLTISNNEYDLNATNQTIMKKMEEIDKGKGVFLVIDSPFSKEINEFLSTNCKNKFAISTDISLQKIIAIVERIESIGATIQSINTMTASAEDDEDNNEPIIIKDHAHELLESIETKLLAESLVFLNPHKASQALYNALLNIITALKIPYNDDLLIKFLYHTTFALERCIRKEPFNYPKSRSLIKANPYLYNVLEENFKIIKEIFSVQIPSTEMGYIIEMFLPYIQK